MGVGLRSVPTAQASTTSGLLQQLRIVRVLAGTSFKLRYADSALGYFWSLARPLALFTILYLVFGRALSLGDATPHYPVFLLIGVVLFTFFSDGTIRTMSSIVDQGALLRRLAFPRLIIPVSVSVTALITFALNAVAIVAFIAWEGIVPRFDWLLIAPLIVELYVFILGVALMLATIYARLRDVGAIWDVAVRAFFYAFAIIFPIQLLPSWAQKVVILNPFTQVMQDIRALVLYDGDVATASEVLGGPIGYLAPFAITIASISVGVWFFKREERWFAERV